MDEKTLEWVFDYIDDNDEDELIDEYFSQFNIKTTKMIKKSDVIKVIKDCVDRPKGVVPDSVYNLIPDIEF